MKLGLDLRGGVHLMEVDMDAAMEKLVGQQEEGSKVNFVKKKSVTVLFAHRVKMPWKWILRNEEQWLEAKIATAI